MSEIDPDNIPADLEEEWRTIFKKYDVSNDGFVNKYEVSSIFAECRVDLSSEELSELMAKSDTLARDGKLNFEEFKIAMCQYYKPQESREAELLAAFKEFDTDNNGYLDKSEMVQILTMATGNEITPQDAEELITKHDVNGDGKIVYNEFITMILQ